MNTVAITRNRNEATMGRRKVYARRLQVSLTESLSEKISAIANDLGRPESEVIVTVLHKALGVPTVEDKIAARSQLEGASDK